LRYEKFEKQYFISMKNPVFMARNIEIFMSFLWRLRKYRRRSRSTGYRRYGPNHRPKRGQRSCVPVLKKGR